MRILIDGRLATVRYGGAAAVAKGIVAGFESLSRIRSDIDVHVASIGQAATGSSGMLEYHIGPAVPGAFQHVYLPKMARDLKADLIFVPRSTVPVVTRCSVATLILDIGWLANPAVYHKQLSQDITTRIALRRATHVFTISDFTAGELARLGMRSDAVSLPIGAIALRRWKPRQDRRYVLTVGAQERHKNLVRLIKCWSALKFMDIDLVVCGRSGKASTEIDDAVDAQRAAGGSSVKLVSDVSEEEITRLHEGCWAYVQPSFYEGLGIPMLEALAAGTPSVSSNAGNCGYVLRGHPELTFDPLDEADLMSKLAAVVGDDEFRCRASELGPTLVGVADWTDIARTIADAAAA